MDEPNRRGAMYIVGGRVRTKQTLLAVLHGSRAGLGTFVEQVVLYHSNQKEDLRTEPERASIATLKANKLEDRDRIPALSTVPSSKPLPVPALPDGFCH